MYWVYVIQSTQIRTGKKGNPLPGFFYVGMTTDPTRRLREHNGLYANGTLGNPKGGKYTSKHRPWIARACYGPYPTRSEALKAEYKLKHSKRGEARCFWTKEDSPLCKGGGVTHPWVSEPTKWKYNEEEGKLHTSNEN
jgi:predicted GIY-YIG superfamily endonuclease